MCLFPSFVKNPKYTETKKNGGKIPPVTDPRVLYVPIGCGDCMECRRQKQRDWLIRLQEDIKTNPNAKFIALTFSNESYRDIITESRVRHLLQKCRLTAGTKLTKTNIIQDITQLNGYERDNAIATTAVRLFLERWRKQYSKSLRHWLVTELGHNGTENIHLHGIIWTDLPITNIENTILEELWTYGIVWKGEKRHYTQTRGTLKNYVNAATINYITKYVTKQDEKHPYYKPIVLASKGIGRNYTNSYNATKNRYTETGTNETYRTESGHKIKIPTYYRNKIYTEEQRELLWIEKLNEKKRYVNGIEISIRENHHHYFKILKQQQEINNKLGYGNGKRNWQQLEYEIQLRELNHQKRINQKTDKESIQHSLPLLENNNNK